MIRKDNETDAEFKERAESHNVAIKARYAIWRVYGMTNKDNPTLTNFFLNGVKMNLAVDFALVDLKPWQPVVLDPIHVLGKFDVVEMHAKVLKDEE